MTIVTILGLVLISIFDSMMGWFGMRIFREGLLFEGALIDDPAESGQALQQHRFRAEVSMLSRWWSIVGGLLCVLGMGLLWSSALLGQPQLNNNGWLAIGCGTITIGWARVALISVEGRGLSSLGEFAAHMLRHLSWPLHPLVMFAEAIRKGLQAIQAWWRIHTAESWGEIYLLAIGAIQQMQWDQVRIYCKRLIAMEPDRADIYNDLARSYSLEPEKAIPLHRQAIDLAPEDPMLWYNFGYSLRARGLWDEAEQAFAESLRLDPSNRRLQLAHDAFLFMRHLKRGETLAAAHEWQKAILELERAIGLIPLDAAPAYRALGVALHGQGHSKQAIEALRQAIVKRCDDPQSHLYLAKVLLVQQHPFHALAHARAARSMGASRREVSPLLLDVERAVAKLSRSQRSSQDGIFRGLASLPTADEWAVIEADREERKEEALAVAKQVLERYARARDKLRQVHMLLQIGNIHIDRGDYDAARAALLQGIELASQCNSSLESRLYQALGIVARRLGDPKSAQQHFTTSLREAFRNGQIINYIHSIGNLGNVAGDLGDWNGAINNFMEEQRLLTRYMPQIRLQPTALGWLALRYETLGLRQDAAYWRYLEHEASMSREALRDLQRANMASMSDLLANPFRSWPDRENLPQRPVQLSSTRSPRRLPQALLLQLQDASKRAQEALSLAQRQGYTYGQIAPLITLGQIYARLGSYRKAVRAWERAISAAERTGDLARLPMVLLGLGNLQWRALGQPNNAFSLYMRALDLLDTIRDRLMPETRATFRARRYEGIAGAVNLALIVEGASKALAIAERIRSRLLLDQLADTFLLPPELPSSLLARESKLLEETRTQLKRLEGADEGAYRQAVPIVQQLETELQQVWDTMERETMQPAVMEYVALRRGLPLGLSEIVSLLTVDTD